MMIWTVHVLAPCFSCVTRSIAHASNLKEFTSAPRLFPTIEVVCEYNLARLRDTGQLIA